MSGIYSEKEESNIEKHSEIREKIIDVTYTAVLSKIEKDPTMVPSREIRLLNEVMTSADAQIQTTATIKAKGTENEQNGMMLSAVSAILKDNTDRLVGKRETPIVIDVKLPDVAEFLVPGQTTMSGTEVPDLEHFKEISRNAGMDDDTK